MDLTGFVFFTIEQNVKDAEPSISRDLESDSDCLSVACNLGFCPKPETRQYVYAQIEPKPRE
ncbi:MAG: hypothetical protein AUF79_19465 [Crenarchaeota archaeon 13_1_20CM_2_51_8]|nr:MAG: hypothetical protein AUF79_19465 [Crenarchaeota archaeon 13_1_20CM_2_51_8]